uniref:Putative secreted protein n=1 Tax=Anopheles darlingi TaxID=43151 RepID=A0A2M4DLL7_ANODA
MRNSWRPAATTTLSLSLSLSNSIACLRWPLIMEYFVTTSTPFIISRFPKNRPLATKAAATFGDEGFRRWGP